MPFFLLQICKHTRASSRARTEGPGTLARTHPPLLPAIKHSALPPHLKSFSLLFAHPTRPLRLMRNFQATRFLLLLLLCRFAFFHFLLHFISSQFSSVTDDDHNFIFYLRILSTLALSLLAACPPYFITFYVFQMVVFRALTVYLRQAFGASE